MSFDYLSSARDAFDALADAGAHTSATWEPGGTYDPATGAGVDPDPVTVTTWGVIFDYSAQQLGTQPDSLIRAGDRQLLLAALDLAGAPIADVPPEARVAGPDGARYIVVACKTLAPAGVAVLHDITVRRP